MGERLLERRERLFPAPDLGGAFEYMLPHRERLTRYVEDLKDSVIRASNTLLSDILT